MGLGLAVGLGLGLGLGIGVGSLTCTSREHIVRVEHRDRVTNLVVT